MLEDIDNYNMLYAITEICTTSSSVGWVRHPTQGFQNATMIRTAEPKNICTFDVTFIPLSGVFGGACEKYIPLSVMEGLEIWMQLDNIANILKYQFVPYPHMDGCGALKMRILIHH